MKIAVIYGGISPERNVSIAGGRAVIDALRAKGHEVVPIDPAFGADQERKAETLTSNIESFATQEELSQFTPRNIIDCFASNLFDGVEFAFILLHGKYGEDGTVQSLLDLRGIPYTSSGFQASAIAMDKITSKNIFLANHITTPPWDVLTPADADDETYLMQVKKILGKNIVVKPADLGSTIGLTRIKDATVEDIADAIRVAAKYSSNILAERYIEGRELTVGILDAQTFPIIEIVPREDFYDYKHKYSKGSTNYICTAEIPEDIANFICNMAVDAYKALGCTNIARADFILDHDGQPYCLEINTIPGFCSTSLVPMAAKQLGIEFGDLCETLIARTLQKRKKVK